MQNIFVNVADGDQFTGKPMAISQKHCKGKAAAVVESREIDSDDVGLEKALFDFLIDGDADACVGPRRPVRGIE